MPFEPGRKMFASPPANFVLIRPYILELLVVRAILATLSATRHGKAFD
jgi:hypothetical protein